MGKDLQKIYPAFTNSPLGQFLSKLQIKLGEIRDARPPKAGDPVEKVCSDQQLAAIAQGFDFVINTALPVFDTGKAPSVFSTSLPGIIKSGISLGSLLPTFYTPQYVVYEAIEKDLGAILTTCLDANKIKSFTEEKIVVFKNALKAEIRKQKEIRFADVSKIPGADLGLILNKLDVFIDTLEFKPQIDRKKLLQELTDDIKEGLIGWNNQLQDFNPPYQLKITDAGLYQLIVEFLLLVDTLPESLDACIPFLNPTALNLNLKSGLIAKLLSAAGLNPFQLTNTSSAESSSAYCYDLSIGTKTTPFNGNDYYREGLPQSRLFLYELLKEYFVCYGETLHVKGERAKAKLIQDFITNETNWLQNKSKPYYERYQVLNEKLPAEMPYGDKLNLLKQKVEAADQLLLDIGKLIEGISSRNYQQQPFADLLAMHGMEDVLKADGSLGLDVSYAVSALPATLIAENQDGSFIAVPVQQTLQTQWYLTLNGLARLQEQIKEQKLALAQQNKLILQEWHEAEIGRHSQENEVWLKRIEAFRAETSDALRLDEIETLHVEDNFDLQIQLISEQLEGLAQHQEKLKKYQAELEVLQIDLNKPVLCSERLRQNDNTIIKEAESCYVPSKEKMLLCVQQLHERAHLFGSRREALEKQLRKAQAAKAFAETMRSSNPEVIEKLLDTKKEQIRISLVEQEKLLQSVNEKRLQLQRDEEGRLLSQLLAKQVSDIQSILIKIETHSKQILQVEPRFNTYFNAERLSSLAGLDAAQDCLNKIFEKQRALENVEDNRDYPQIRAALSAAYNCIDSKGIFKSLASLIDSKGMFPFKSLAALPALKAFAIDESDGFDALLFLLDDPGTTKQWLGYKKSGTVLGEQRQQLLELIKARILSCESKIEGRRILEKAQKDFANAHDSLQFINDMMIFLPTLCEDIRKLTQHRELKQNALPLAIEQEENSLVKEKEVATILNQDVNVLQQIVDLLKGCQALNQMVAAVEASDTEFGSADLLYENEKIINERITKVVEQQDKLKRLLAQLMLDVNDSTAYLPNIETIASLLISSEQRVLKFREGIFSRKISDLQAQIQTNKEAMAAIGKTFPVRGAAGQEISSGVQLSQLNTLLMQYSSFADARALIAARRGLIENDLQAINTEDLEGQFSLVSNSAQQLKLGNERLLVSCLNQIDVILKTYEKELQTHSITINVDFVETTECYDATQSIFADTENYLKEFPQTALTALANTLKNLKPASEAVLGKIQAVCQASEALKGLLTQKQAIHTALNERIEARKNFAADFGLALDRYLVQRNGKYALKDYIFWTDCFTRKQFVDKVMSELKMYAESGNSEPLFAYINSERGKFAGYNLQTILSQLLHGLTEQDKKIPKNYNDNQSKALIIEHQRALAALATLDIAGNNNAEFVNAIKQLYIEIEGIEQYGEKLGGLTDKQGKTVIELALALRTKVDTFIISNQGQEITQQAVASFQTEFMYLAHTQDELMSKHASWWAPIFANMLAAVTTFGIAVGWQLAASKWSTGRFAFYYDRSVGLERVGAVEKAAGALAAPAA